MSQDLRQSEVQELWEPSDVTVNTEVVRNRSRYEYIKRVVGPQIQLIDPVVVRAAADGMYSDTIPLYRDEIDRLARLLAKGDAVLSRLGRGSYIASRTREFKKMMFE